MGVLAGLPVVRREGGFAFVVVVVVMVALFLRGAGHVVDHQLGTLAVAFRVHGFFSLELLLMVAVVVVSGCSGFEASFGAGRFVEVLPCLAVVAVEAVSGFAAGRIERGYCVAVWGRPVTIVFGTLIPENHDRIRRPSRPAIFW